MIKNWCFWTVVLEKTLEESLGLQGDPTSPFWRRSALGFLWKELCWSLNSSTLAISCEELTHWKRLRCWEGLEAGGEGDDRGWDGWMASLTRWMWVSVNSGSWWWTGRPGVLRFMWSQKVGQDWATDLIWSTIISFVPARESTRQGFYYFPVLLQELVEDKPVWYLCVKL